LVFLKLVNGKKYDRPVPIILKVRKNNGLGFKFELIFAFDNKSETMSLRAKREIFHKLLH
jgi:hypothetical protein